MVAVRVEPEEIPMQGAHVKDDLRATLDDHLEGYLNLVHQYQSLQKSLSQGIASGFFSLAQANFTNAHCIRYGQDFYDERMQASTRFVTGSPSNGPTITIPIPGDNSVRDDREFRLVTLPPKPRESSETKQADGDQNVIGEEVTAEPQALVSDPLRWFGILVPPALRASQSSFRSAVTEIVPSLANVSSAMKILEIEIRRTRKKIKKAG